MKKQNIQEFIEYNDDRFTKRVVFKEGGSTVFVLNFKPGQTLPTHKHPGTNVYLYVVTGEGTLTIDGESSNVTRDDVIVVSGEEDLSFENSGSENVSLYVMLNKIPSEKYAQDI